MTLPPNATVASQTRLAMAQALVAHCPETLFDRIALTGSSARGFATEQSDIEINFWIDPLPASVDRAGWLQPAAEATGYTLHDVVIHDEPRPDQSYWINANLRSMAQPDAPALPIELGWQTPHHMQRTLDDIQQARDLNHKTQRIADLILHAVSLRGDKHLVQWQAQLQDYPDNLQRALIKSVHSTPSAFPLFWTALKDTPPAGQNALMYDITTGLLRIVFALNRHYEINWKYTLQIAHELPIMPDNFIGWLQFLQDGGHDYHGMRAMTSEVLELIPDELR